MAQDLFEIKDKIVCLLRKYFRDELSVGETIAFEKWLSADKKNQELFEMLCNDDFLEAELKIYKNSGKPGIWEKIKGQL